MRWRPFRRPDALSPEERLAEQAASAETALAAGRYELARAGFDETVTEYWQQLVERPDDVDLTDRLARSLYGLAATLTKLGLVDEATAVREEAMSTSRRAIELHRAAADGRPDPALAVALRTFALVRAHTGLELDEAEVALDQAMALHMALLTASSSTSWSKEHLDEAYATELAQAQLLSRQGKHVEAARTAERARSGHLDGLLDMLRAQRGP